MQPGEHKNNSIQLFIRIHQVAAVFTKI